MRRTGLIAGVVLTASMSSLLAEERPVIRLDENSPALHFPVGRRDVQVEPAFEDYASMMFDVCDAMELSDDECLIFPMNGDLGGNAVATIVDGNPVILYDRALSPIVGYPGAMFVIGHELGHHYCGHIGTGSDPEKELEADRFSAAAMRKAGFSLDNALAAAALFDTRPSRSHPPREERDHAIRAAWNNPKTGKDCH